MEFPRQEYWSGLPFPSPEDLPDPGIEPWSPSSQVDSLPFELQGSPYLYSYPKQEIDGHVTQVRMLRGDRQQTAPVLWRFLLGSLSLLPLLICAHWRASPCRVGFPAQPSALTRRCWIIIKDYFNSHLLSISMQKELWMWFCLPSVLHKLHLWAETVFPDVLHSLMQMTVLWLKLMLEFTYIYGNVDLMWSLILHVCVWVTQLCPTLCNPINCSLPGSSVHGILQARILEWVAMPFSRGSSQPRDRTQVSCMAGGFFTVWATRDALDIECRFYLMMVCLISKPTCFWTSFSSFLHSRRAEGGGR